MLGDSGGPLVYEGPNGLGVLLGVLSIVPHEASNQGPNEGTNENWPCAYTRVDNGDPYRAWLDSMIAIHGGR